MTASTFHLLDLHFDQRTSASFEFTMEMDRLRRTERLRTRLEELVHPVFTACEAYLNGRLKDAVECYVEREPGLDFGMDPNASFRWGAQGDRLNTLRFSGNPETGEIHGTWRCWRSGTPFHGEVVLTPLWESAHTKALLQELILNFSPLQILSR